MNETSDKIYSVGEVSSLIKSLLDKDQRLRSIHVRGEISTCRLVTSGHFYFTLKDEGGNDMQTGIRPAVSGESGTITFIPIHYTHADLVNGIAVMEKTSFTFSIVSLIALRLSTFFSSFLIFLIASLILIAAIL